MGSSLAQLDLRKPATTSVISRLPRTQWLVAGVDGGGTGTRAIIMDQKQRVIGEGRSGPSNPLRVGIANAATNVREAVDRACAEAAIHRDDIAFVTIGLA